MSLQYRFFSIPAKNPMESEAELNQGLRSVRVISIHREFVAQGDNSYWSLAVEYLADGQAPPIKGTGKSKIDYREVLAPEDFAVFVKLREWRKEVATQEAVPVYTIFTNDQLAKIAEKRIATLSALREIEGIGDARVAKYGDALLRTVAGALTQQNRMS